MNGDAIFWQAFWWGLGIASGISVWALVVILVLFFFAAWQVAFKRTTGEQK